MLDNLIKIHPERITNAGLIARVIKETPKQVEVLIIDCFFPIHHKPTHTFQITGGSAEHFRECMIGQKRKFWKTGKEVGHTHTVVDWDLLKL